MVDGLICAIAKKISDTFDKRFAVYTESVHQGVEKPCFFVECEKAERVEMLNRNFFVRVSVKITFENDNDMKHSETEGVIAGLFDLLGNVCQNSVAFNGRKIHGKWEEGSFVVRASYDMWTQREKEAVEMMERLEVNQELGMRSAELIEALKCRE